MPEPGQSLLPVTTDNATAMDTVLLRLVLAASPQAADVLDGLEELVRIYPVASEPATGLREYVNTDYTNRRLERLTQPATPS